MTQARLGQQVVVLGAGMVGISCALSLRQRGLAVTVIDPLGPGAATSHGNAGVLARSSLMPFNHPRLWPQLPPDSLVIVDKGFYSASLLWPLQHRQGRHWLIPARAGLRGEVVQTHGPGDVGLCRRRRGRHRPVHGT